MGTPPPAVHEAPASSSRERLVRIAGELLEEGGTSAVTFREVGRRAGLSHNAAHKLFGGKEELLAAVAADGLDELRAVLATDDRAGAAESVRTLLHVLVEQARARPRLFELTYSAWPSSPPELTSVALAGRHQLAAAVARGQAAGELLGGDSERTASLLLAVAQGASRLELLGHLDLPGDHEPVSARDLVDDVVALLAPTRRTGTVP